MGRRGDLSPDDTHIWTVVTDTVSPRKRAKAPRVAEAGPIGEPVPRSGAATSKRPTAGAPAPAPSPSAPVARPRHAPEVLEPRRQRRLARERDPIEATFDLHGFGRFDAEDRLRAFLGGSQARGLKAVLVITGQGRRGGGVIRASIHEWLQSPVLRGVVSGFAMAHRRHGGDGAIYITLKQKAGA
ncbi:MAG: Smr/MutS family protein [Pseudomonadota bacterium]